MARAPFQVLVIPYRLTDDGRTEYALFLRADLGVWQAIAGGGEDDETPGAAARREAFEEAGIPFDAPLLPLDSRALIPARHFAAAAEWGADLTVIPEYTFGIEVTDALIRLSAEHDDMAWLPFEQAVARFEWESNRAALRELEARLAAEKHTTMRDSS